MEEKIRKQNIQRLNINDKSIELLNRYEIKTLDQLCKKSKSELKDIGLLPNEANKIEIELELLGLNLRNSL